VVRALNRALNEAIGDARVRERLGASSVQTRPNTPEDLGAFFEAETAKWGRLVREVGIRPD
jgi:tripartite-type tricarboxylate transporter receptor subunit TctC